MSDAEPVTPGPETPAKKPPVPAPARPATASGRRRVFATLNLTHNGRGLRAGQDISHLPEQLLSDLLDRGDASVTPPAA